METGSDLIRRWRDMADECRARAAEMADEGARSSFLHMARTYEAMAERFAREASKRATLEAAKWLTGADPGPSDAPAPIAPEGRGSRQAGQRRG
jgi:hypothetical protein